MTNPVISPDGKWMWTGTEWIPAPPSSTPPTTPNIVMQDSVIAGDVNISNNNIEDIKKAMLDVLLELDFNEGPINNELTAQDIENMDKALELSSQLIENEIQLEPKFEMVLAEIAWKKRHTEPIPKAEESELLKQLQISHLKRAYEQYEKADDLKNAAHVMKKWLSAIDSYPRDNRYEVFNLATKALELSRRAPDRNLEVDALTSLAWSDIEENQHQHKKSAEEIREKLNEYKPYFLGSRLPEMTLVEGNALISKMKNLALWISGSEELGHSTYKHIGIFYLRHNQLEMAEEWLLKSLEKIEDGLTYHYLGKLEMQRNDFKKAMDYFSLQLEHEDELGWGRIICLCNIGTSAEAAGFGATLEGRRSFWDYYERACLLIKKVNPQTTEEDAISFLEANGVSNAESIILNFFDSSWRHQ